MRSYFSFRSLKGFFRSLLILLSNATAPYHTAPPLPMSFTKLFFVNNDHLQALSPHCVLFFTSSCRQKKKKEKNHKTHAPVHCCALVSVPYPAGADLQVPMLRMHANQEPELRTQLPFLSLDL